MSKKTKAKKITRSTKWSEVLEDFPKAGEVLARDYQFHCLGCFASQFETVEEGAKAHGLNDEEIDKMIISLNKVGK